MRTYRFNSRNWLYAISLLLVIFFSLLSLIHYEENWKIPSIKEDERVIKYEIDELTTAGSFDELAGELETTNSGKRTRNNFTKRSFAKLSLGTTGQNDKVTSVDKYHGSITERFQERYDLLQKYCPITSKNDIRKRIWIFNDNFLVDIEKKILVCAVPKAGSTNWHMLMWKLRRKRKELSTDVKYYSYNDTLDNIEFTRRVSSFEGNKIIKFQSGIDDVLSYQSAEHHRLILVRHPFARLISGWNQKFHKDSQYWRDLYVRYPGIQKFKTSSDESHEMIFANFVDFVVHYGSNVDALDYHFKPVSGLCRPCDYAYTYIVKVETFDQDEAWLKQKMNITGIEIGHEGKGPSAAKTLENQDIQNYIEHYMSTLSIKSIKRLIEIFADDFQLFGYTFDPYTLQSGGFE